MWIAPRNTTIIHQRSRYVAHADSPNIRDQSRLHLKILSQSKTKELLKESEKELLGTEMNKEGEPVG